MNICAVWGVLWAHRGIEANTQTGEVPWCGVAGPALSLRSPIKNWGSDDEDTEKLCRT